MIGLELPQGTPPITPEPIQFGPWEGSMRSVSADLVPPEFAASVNGTETNMLYVPRRKTFRRRKGMVQKFDTFGSAVGMLPSYWGTLGGDRTTYGAKCRQLEEYTSASISDNIPSLIALLTRETMNSNQLDNGRFSTVWIRDQVQNLNYTLGSEYSGTTYPAPTTVQTYRYPAFWYDSGDGGLTRGTSEFARRFFVSGSRKFSKVGNWHYFPSLLATPSRMQIVSEASVGTLIQANGDANDERYHGASGGNVNDFFLQSVGATVPNTRWTIADVDGNKSTAWESLQVDNSDTSFIYMNNAAPSFFPTHSAVKFASVSSSYTQWRITVRAKLTSSFAGDHVFGVALTDSAGNTYTSSTTAISGITAGSYTTLTYNVNASNITATAATANRLDFIMSTASNSAFAPGFYITYMKVEPLSASASTTASYLFPAGPIPPTHAGTLSAADADITQSDQSILRPASDISTGSWTSTAGDMWSVLDETTDDDTDYISLGTGQTGQTAEVKLQGLGFTPNPDDAVSCYIRISKSGVASPTLLLELVENATVKATATANPIGTSFALWGFSLSHMQITSISDWSDLRLRMVGTTGGANTISISKAYLTYEAAITTGTVGGWKGADRFYYSVAYRFEDDSIWMFAVPRGKNDTLTSGWNLFTINQGNPTATYKKITWSNLPYPPKGVKRLVLLRTPKIDSTTESDLVLDPHDMRVVAEVDAGVTTYLDFFADDDSLTQDVDGLFIREDHIMMPRSRYIFGGDARVCVSYSGLNPSAIVIAPIGDSADYHLNVSDSSSTAYAGQMYMRISCSSSSVYTLSLYKSDGASFTQQKDITLTSLTLQGLVDTINATSFAVDGQQWRAQLCPGVNPDAAATSLTPHRRTIASVTVDNTAKTITATSGLSKVAVGALIASGSSDPGTITSAYVTSIDSDTQLTYSGSVTGSPTTLSFYFELGNTPYAATASGGYQRVISNSLPGFLYFNKTYLNQFPIDKNAVWMTVASPGSVKSAANAWSGKLANKHTPPLEAGISMGGYAVDNGFVVPFSKKTAAIRNTRDFGTGIDSDYKLFIINESRGCISWQSVAAGSRCGAFMSAQGIVACDLGRDELISDAIYHHAVSDETATGSSAVTSVGDFTYEAPLCDAATAKDDDTAYLSCWIIRGNLWVNYRASGTHPNRQVVYDFSEGRGQGLDAMLRPDGRPWGWSYPISRLSGQTAMCEGRRGTADGSGVHLYGWNEENAGSTGDGRIDEIETSDTDNGTAITGTLTTPWFRFGGFQLSGQRIFAEHFTPTGATVALSFVRSYSGDAYSFTPTATGSAVVTGEWKDLTLPARAQTRACYLKWQQTAGQASEVRSLMLLAKRMVLSLR